MRPTTFHEMPTVVQPVGHVEVMFVSTEPGDVSPDRSGTSPDDESGSTEIAPPTVWPSAIDRALVVLLRVTGQMGGPGWLARLYAVLLYVTVATVSVMSVTYFMELGVNGMRNGSGILEAAFASYFFGCVQALPMLPLTATVIRGRRRYAALLPEVQQLAEELAREIPRQSIRGKLRKKAALLLGVAVVIVAIGCVLTLLMIMVGFGQACARLSSQCLMGIFLFTTSSIIAASTFSIPIKFLYITLVVGVGFGAVDTELQSLARNGDIKDWNRLARLRLLHDRLSGAFSRLVTDMTPELILSMTTGVISLVITFLLGFQTTLTGEWVSNYHSMLYSLLAAGLQIAVPCEAGQHVLDLATATRCSLLKLRWESTRVGREVSALQEAVRRDLDHLGDLGYYRLQRSTMVAIMSTIVTYIVIFVQFRIS
ncbi:hypothetical protein FJT64_006128 [Amphibalanus amphitrite]|uniref:Gustatory receptor n=1 Tax=Amphibalanus amphitrite TaxID=1232801 RepID=A0A6A4VJ66_AMPAM|nr:hypothetical protein FJT64_006128 [Amphibalanus amphitrite]